TAKKHLVAFSTRLYETTIPFAPILSLSTFAKTSSKSQHSLMDMCPIFFIPGAVPADMKPAEWTDLLNLAIQVDCRQKIFPPVSHSRTPSLAADALATVNIFVDTRLVKWTNFYTCWQIPSFVDGFLHLSQSDGSFKLLNAPANRQRFRKSGTAQDDVSVGRKYWSLDAWFKIEDEHRCVSRVQKRSLQRLRRREVHTAYSTVQRDDAAVYDDEAPHERALYYSEKMKTKQA
ncbi:hypothetical protein M378DRAFT_173773, partial [Amanita muscaria Koide BX008]